MQGAASWCECNAYHIVHKSNLVELYLHSSKACLPYLLKSDNPHILNMAPPLNMNPRWLADHSAYTISKYGMSMCVLGLAEEFRGRGVAVNALWPRIKVHTAAVDMLFGPEGELFARKAEIMADAAYAIICRNAKAFTGNFCIDEDVLLNEGVKDFDRYACYLENKDKLSLALFIDDKGPLAKL